MRISHLIILFFILVIGCDKPIDDIDYREPYTGEFAFTTIKKIYSMCYDSSVSCVNGWTFKSDTTLFTSSIEPIDRNRLEIQFGNGILGIKNQGYYDSDTIFQTFNLIILPEGKLEFPETENYNLRSFNGYYIGFDTIIMDMRYGLSGIGIYTQYEVTGVRKK